MKRALFVICGFSFLVCACTQRTICPAFQSAYIYDKDALRKKFSYFDEDSTPKILTASKNKYLVVEAVPYKRKLSKMATVEMKDVVPVVPDSLTMDEEVSLAELDEAARSVIDSTYIVDVEQQEDTAAFEEEYMISKDREVRVLRFSKDSVSYKVDEVRFNTDQDNYMWYLRDHLVLPDVRLMQLKGKAEDEEVTAKKERKGIRGFFKNLFKKKKKEEVPADTTEMEIPVERSEYDLDYADEDKPQPDEAEPVKEKKGFGLFRKKEKNKEEGKISSGRQQKVKKEKPKKEKPQKTKSEDEEKPADDEVKGDEGF